MISFEPSDDEKEILKTVERFAEVEVRATMRDIEAAGRPPEELRRKYHEMGLGMLNYPETVGGSGMGQVTRALIEEALSFGDPGAAIGLDGPGLAGLAILELGEGAHDERYLAPFAGPDAHLRTDQRIGADAHRLGKLCARIDDRGRVDRGHGRSAPARQPTSRIVHISSASTASSSPTCALALNL